MKRRRLALGLAALIVVTAIAVAAVMRSPAPPAARVPSGPVETAIKELDLIRPSPPKPAEDFAVRTPRGRTFRLSEQRGKIVFINFWATWCPPCIDETPSLVKMQTHLKDKGVVVLAVSIDADDAAYHKFLKDYSVNMITVRDEARKASSLYGTFGWPESYIIDRNGVIRRKFIGAVDWTSPEIVEYLTKL